jgi:hypothetical protein
MDFRGLAEAVAEVPPPPCEVHKCKHRDQCAKEQLACKAFQDYVHTGLAVIPHGLPSKRKYNAVMREGDHPQARGGHRTVTITGERGCLPPRSL